MRLLVILLLLGVFLKEVVSEEIFENEYAEEEIWSVSVQMEQITSRARDFILFLENLKIAIDNDQITVQVPEGIDHERSFVSIEVALEMIKDLTTMEMALATNFLSKLDQLDDGDEISIISEQNMTSIKKEISIVLSDCQRVLADLDVYTQIEIIEFEYESLYENDDEEKVRIIPYGEDAFFEKSKLASFPMEAIYWPIVGVLFLILCVTLFVLIARRRKQKNKTGPKSLAEETEKVPSISVISISVE